jgi:DNA processing protein
MLVEKIRASDPVELAEKEIAYADKIGASIITMGEEGYPEPLLTAFAPPPVLSINGDWLKSDSVSIAVVGTRNPTNYGKIMTQKMTTALVNAGFTIVSGLARGVDGIAHRTAIEQGGRTTAMLGCGLNIYYPPEHRELQKQIPKHGAVMSQFSFTIRPGKTLFPIRNRVISGLSIGTLVIEAPEKSGALITAYSALNDNRDVFALPGPVNSRNSEGTNKLIKKGHAKLVQSVDDIIDELPDYIRDQTRTKQVSLNLQEVSKLTEDEKTVIGHIDNSERHIDHVAVNSGLPLSKVSAILLSLEIKGLVKQVAGKMFLRL